jgi:hypothetical protein
MAPRKSSQRGRGKGNHMFERTLEDLKSSIDTLGKLVSSYLPGGTQKKTTSRKTAATAARKRTSKASPRRKPASAKTRAAATTKA